jgi:hypothetical protein
VPTSRPRGLDRQHELFPLRHKVQLPLEIPGPIRLEHHLVADLHPARHLAAPVLAMLRRHLALAAGFRSAHFDFEVVGLDGQGTDPANDLLSGKTRIRMQQHEK